MNISKTSFWHSYGVQKRRVPPHIVHTSSQNALILGIVFGKHNGYKTIEPIKNYGKKERKKHLTNDYDIS